MAPAIGDEIRDESLGQGRPSSKAGTALDRKEGPDPVVGAGITLLGIFLMGTGGARDAHYVFDFGVATAVLGAGVFVLSVALSAMRQRHAGAVSSPSQADEPPASA